MQNQSKKRISEPSSAIYGMAFIGALIYFIQQASTFGTGVLGVFKALFWPVVLMYEVLKFLKV
jgi:hypothetical protein